MGAQSKRRTHHDVVEGGRARIDQELASFGRLNDAAQISGIDLLDNNAGRFAEKVACTGEITVATRHMMSLASK
jgi:hypothetical protein